MKILFETVNNKKVLKEFKNATLAKNFIVKNKDKLSKAQILDEGIGDWMKNIGKGAMTLACIGAAMIGFVNKPAEAKNLVSPTSYIEQEEEFQNGDEKGVKLTYQDENRSGQHVFSNDKNCEKMEEKIKTTDNYDQNNHYWYHLECKSPEGPYTISVSFLNDNNVTKYKTNNSNLSDESNMDSISVEFNGETKSIDLDNPKMQKLKQIVLNALKRDKKDGKIVVDMVNNVQPYELQHKSTIGKNYSHNSYSK